MSKIFTIARFKIHPGNQEEFKKLANECVDIVKAREPNTLFYEWFLNNEETECVAIDCYTDFDAMWTHVQNIGPLMRRLMVISDRHLEIYGEDPSEKLAGRGTAKPNEYVCGLFRGKI